MTDQKKAFLVLLVGLVTAVLLLSPFQSGANQNAVSQIFLPMVLNFKPLSPYMIKDVNTKTPSSHIYCPVALNDRMLCSAWDPEHGYELWKSNGKRGGAALVKDIAPDYDSYAMHHRWPFAKLNNMALFLVQQRNVLGYELWKSNGTSEGTVLVKGQFLDLESDIPFTVVNNLMYFVAHDGEHGLELWRSDGTTNGTFMVRDILPGLNGGGVGNLTPLGNKLYFTATDTFGSYPLLWFSDGTKAGTMIVSAVSDSAFGSIAALDDFLILNMHEVDLFQPSSLWRIDGDGQNLEKLSDFGVYQGLYLSQFASLTDKVVFLFTHLNFEGHGIGTSDGTAKGTDLFIKVEERGAWVYNLTAAGAQAFFINKYHPQPKEELWRTDGTAVGTVLLGTYKEANETTCPWNFFVVDSGIFFSADDELHGCELWHSDGTPAGTKMVRDIASGVKSSWPTPGVIFKDLLFFSASDSLGDGELWKTDGTESDTVRADDVHDSPTNSSNPRHYTAHQDGIYFSAHRGGDSGLWRSDGTELGTEMVKSFGSRSIDDPIAYTPWVMTGDWLYLIADYAVWRSDGTEAGTIKLTGPEECDAPQFLTAVGSEVYFFSEINRLCRAGTPHVKVKDLGGDRAIDALGGDSLLFFRLSSGKMGISDGTPGGTKIYDSPLATLGPAYPLAGNGDVVYFNGNNELWKLVGKNNPKRITYTEPGLSLSRPYGLTMVGDEVVFSADLNPYGRLLWRSDGSNGGTYPIAPVSMCGTGEGSLTAAFLGGRLYFPGSLFEDEKGCEFWATDGSFEGTERIKDIRRGSDSSFPDQLTTIGKAVYFKADDGKHGRRLWSSDGTSAGTKMAVDPSSEDGSYSGMIDSNGRLFFIGDAQRYGLEPWAMLLP